MANASDVFNDEAERQNLASTPEFADDVERLAAELAGYTHCAPPMHARARDFMDGSDLGGQADACWVRQMWMGI